MKSVAVQNYRVITRSHFVDSADALQLDNLFGIRPASTFAENHKNQPPPTSHRVKFVLHRPGSVVFGGGAEIPERQAETRCREVVNRSVSATGPTLDVPREGMSDLDDRSPQPDGCTEGDVHDAG
jgi:hypothetical protein